MRIKSLKKKIYLQSLILQQTVIDEIMEEANHYNRIYVASVHQDLSENDIKSVFEAFGKIRMCLLTPATAPGKHKGYGFIEYETPQSAQEAIASMNLFDLGGQYLRVGRAITPPGSFYGPLQAPTQMPTAAAVAAAAATAKIQAMDALATNIGIASSITAALTQQQQQQMASLGAMASLSTTIPDLTSIASVTSSVPGVPPVGVVTAPTVPTIGLGAAIPPPTLLGVTPSTVPTTAEMPQIITTTTIAQQIMDSMSQQQSAAVTLTAPTLMELTAAVTTASPSSMASAVDTAHQEELQKKLLDDSEPQTLRQQENMSIKGQSARHLVMQKLMRKSESNVIILRNMVGVDGVDQYLQEDITEECSRYGTVEHLIIYQEKQSEEEDAEIIVKIFVEFSKTSEAESARDALNGRYFAGRLVKADLYDKNLYDHNDLSG